MITDLVQIKRLGEKNRVENLKFRRYMKSHGFVERQFRKAAEEVTDQINCREWTECRRCDGHFGVTVTLTCAFVQQH